MRVKSGLVLCLLVTITPSAFAQSAIAGLARDTSGGGFSGSLREATGLPQSRIYVLTTSNVPGLTQVTQNVQAAPRGDYRFPWVNLVDVRFARGFQAGSARIEPTMDIYNVFNNNAVTNGVTTIGSSLGRPSSIVMGRLFRIGGRLTF